MSQPLHATPPEETPARPNRPAVYDRLGPEALREALRRMLLVRRFEEGAEEAYMRGLIHGTMHLSIGQEASAIGICSALEERDYITSTHRGHGHCIGKGAEVKRMFAEFFGKETGYCRGRGGSMHIADPARGNLGANGIVGGGIPIAVGAALSAKRRGTGAVAISFFGDGANNEGAFHEALNMASLWRLPVVFVCENNGYGMSTSMARATAVPNVADRAAAYGMPGVIVDGNRFADVAEAAFAAVERARRGEGPTLIESKTYRIRGHSRSDRNRYRTKEEIESWQRRDPIKLFEEELTGLGILRMEEIVALRAEVEAEIAAAIDYAKDSPAPDVAALTRDVYAREIRPEALR
ncbi:thiamine pyrophosphate-dependent dehydrogenase E1 component subunit alpha [Pseudoroseomonas cervicalis]|uniref:thiamine pyrophosphate-dependent dehydrogenase E1 component subunit alpha n=1 Tax=Teichococcus cervicalis TaxID=204525 RepID=UPI0022F191CF|nr:thiamine pyrophosphate-dependent dehydrogenase E1 component subunit alpha [Pseudoroseomonas cervicalis]WBV45309.1 thiamine pyrophosphate-dependent dehydrogenase E1 component subunit alpha [Pseudoroseomonas cervicalis]